VNTICAMSSRAMSTAGMAASAVQSISANRHAPSMPATSSPMTIARALTMAATLWRKSAEAR
jgi:hypothetical protein